MSLSVEELIRCHPTILQARYRSNIVIEKTSYKLTIAVYVKFRFEVVILTFSKQTEQSEMVVRLHANNLLCSE